MQQAIQLDEVTMTSQGGNVLAKGPVEVRLSR
jgi:hypothetical protein